MISATQYPLLELYRVFRVKTRGHRPRSSAYKHSYEWGNVTPLVHTPFSSLNSNLFFLAISCDSLLLFQALAALQQLISGKLLLITLLHFATCVSLSCTQKGKCEKRKEKREKINETSINNNFTCVT